MLAKEREPSDMTAGIDELEASLDAWFAEFEVLRQEVEQCAN